MKKVSFILVSIILWSCNGSNSVRNQEYADVDSAVIDTMDVQPLKDESHKKLAKNKTEDPLLEHIIVMIVTIHMCFNQTRWAILRFKEEVFLFLLGNALVRMLL